MPGHKLSKPVKMKLKRGAVVQVWRGWRRGELASSASACRRISPSSGETIGLFAPHWIEVPAGQLRIRCGWRRKRIMVRPC